MSAVDDRAGSQDSAVPSDDLPNPLEDKRRALRQEALTTLLNGHGENRVEQRGPSTVMRVGTAESARAANSQGEPAAEKQQRAQYVELQREKTDRIFAVLVEFGDETHPDYPDKDINPDIAGPSTFAGPVHNAIPEPDRSKDNSTVWQPNYSRKHFQQIYFGEGAEPGAGEVTESVKTYYERQSSGRYSVDGTVTSWVKVPYNEARYGRSNDPVADGEVGDDPAVCDSIVCDNTWNLVQDAVNTWVEEQRAKGRTPGQITRQLRTFDRWDRYDHDADGDFNEPDGYIDHFQIVHAGGDQADGDPQQGEDAIWSHRWKAFQNRIGLDGPSFNKDGGTPVGATGLWVADYTIQPENGGVSVFAHKYGHDLGLPDHYDAATDNPVSWWTLMGQSRNSAPQDQGIGTRAADLGAWDKLQLGWLDYEIVPAGQTRTLELGPHEYNSAKAQGVVVPLPQKTVTTDLGAPAAGSKQWWSGTGDDYEATLSRQVAVPAGSPTLTFQARWNIEDCGPDPCDFAFVEVDSGSGWTAIPGSITKPAEKNGIDGIQETYKAATFDLSSFAGQTIGLRIRYATDGGTQGNAASDLPPGFYADAFKVTSGSTTVFEDGGESGNNGWTPTGFKTIPATKDEFFDHYYVASNRQYLSYDQYLKSGPYNVINTAANPNWVEHFPYQNGLIVSYWDTSHGDNDTLAHPGEG
ncbi:MAG: immune inhibitor A domain-containing protein, partial [Nocardioidaceae bacterium]